MLELDKGVLVVLHNGILNTQGLLRDDDGQRCVAVINQERFFLTYFLVVEEIVRVDNLNKKNLGVTFSQHFWF